jgi:hypothetical protein
MALRIGGKPPIGLPPIEEDVTAIDPAEEALLEELAGMEEEALEEDPLPEEPAGVGVVDPLTAGYKGPEEGPFNCGNCKFFVEDGTCQIVSGPVEAEGLCNMFTSKAGDEPLDEEIPEPMEESAEEEPLGEELA